MIMPGTDGFSRYHNNFTDNKWMFIGKNYNRGLKSGVLTFSGFTSKCLITGLISRGLTSSGLTTRGGLFKAGLR